jgi:hypothetical protein
LIEFPSRHGEEHYAQTIGFCRVVLTQELFALFR